MSKPNTPANKKSSTYKTAGVVILILLAKLKRLSEKYPDKIYPECKERPGAVSYIVPKSCVSVREPYSDARRRAASERAKNAGYMPPARSASPENE